MGNQNTSDKNTTETETSQKSDRELATALCAMALATQDPSPIFKLNVDCWEEIFDWLSVVDVHALGQTCKFFHRIAGKYFEWKYRSILVQLPNDYWEGFNEYVQRLAFYDLEPDTSLLYASENCKSPKELQILNLRSTNLDMNRLEKMLANVEILRFWNLFISDEFMESIIKLCATNLRRLRIDKCTEYGWMHHKLSKLQHLELYECNSSEELIKFFGQNPNVRSFSTATENILKYQEELMASNIELDDLTLLIGGYGFCTNDGILTPLINLYKRGFYKRLHFTTITQNYLIDLPGLTTIYINSDEYFEMPHLPTVTGLSFRPLWNGLCSMMDIDQVSNALVNLERILMTDTTSIKYMMPFIRNSKRLKEIKLEYYRDDTMCDLGLDPVLMQSEREKLNGATKVTIYVKEEDYLRIKWELNKSDFGLIEIKRYDGYDGLWDHNFDHLWW